MAKWGEGDPRWIVEERPDATNVNNWHWTEKNATPWSKERLHQLFDDFKIEEDDFEFQIESLDKCDGEATANNRKGKLIFFYEWELELKWLGRLKKSKDEHKGKLTIPNLSEEKELDEIEITVTIDESNDESETLKQIMYNFGREKIRQQLGQYVKELKEEYSKNLILPKKVESSSTTANNSNVTPSNINTTKSTKLNSINNTTGNSNNSDANKIQVGYKLDVKTLEMKVNFQCSANDLYNALTKVDMLSAFTRSSVKVDASVGGEFVLYGGNVQGKYEELIPEKRIVQSWRLKNWISGHYSNVTIEFNETKNCTVMSLTQTGIPLSEYDAMFVNWHRYYWQSIMETFGFGSRLMDGL